MLESEKEINIETEQNKGISSIIKSLCKKIYEEILKSTEESAKYQRPPTG